MSWALCVAAAGVSCSILSMDYPLVPGERRAKSDTTPTEQPMKQIVQSARWVNLEKKFSTSSNYTGELHK
jgi:hypothetical protein